MIMCRSESGAPPCLLQGAEEEGWWAPQVQLNLPRGQISESAAHIPPQDGFAGHFRERKRPGATTAAPGYFSWKMAFSSQHSLDTGAHSCIPPGWGQGWGELLPQSAKVLSTGPAPLRAAIRSGCSPGAALSQPSRSALLPSKQGRGCPPQWNSFPTFSRELFS